MIIEQDATIDQKTAWAVSISEGRSLVTYRFIDLEGLPCRHIMLKVFSLVGIFNQYLMLDLLDTIFDVLGLKVFLFIIVDVFDL